MLRILEILEILHLMLKYLKSFVGCILKYFENLLYVWELIFDF